MVATSRSAIPGSEGFGDDRVDLDAGPETAPTSSPRNVQAAALEMMDHAMHCLVQAREERLKAEAATSELRRERERFTFEYERLRADDISRLREKQRVAQPQRSVLGSLQFVAGCALVGIVVSGIVLGHDIRGFDPGYVGALLGLLGGGSVWAIRGL